MIRRCDVAPQNDFFKSRILERIGNIISSGRYILDDNVEQFEQSFSTYLGVDHCISCGNGTDGLVLALQALGVKPGDEVITTPFTAIPTLSAIVAAGAQPVFVDICPESFLMEPNGIANKITERTKAILPVHLFGNPLDVEKIREQVPSHVAVVEDACQAAGSAINGRKVGASGNLSVFSFYPTKNLGGIGDSGSITTNSEELANSLRLLRMYGMVDKDHIETHGSNSRMDAIQAAILCEKLLYLDKMNQSRVDIAESYRDYLSDCPVRFQKITPGGTSNYHVLCVVVENRKQLIKQLDNLGIQTNIYYPVPLHLQKANSKLGYKLGDLPIAENLTQNILAVPLYPELPAQHFEKTVEAIRGFYEKPNPKKITAPKNKLFSPVVSIVLPTLNEIDNAELMYQRITEVFKDLEFRYEIIFVDDASQDQTIGAVKKLRATDPQVKYLLMSRRFGDQPCLMAGISKATGDAVITMDADLQHPPEKIPEMIRLWQQGYHKIILYRSKEGHDSFFKKYTEIWFYSIINKISDVAIYPRFAGFCLLDRTVVNSLNRHQESEPFFRGLVSRVGFSQIEIPYEEQTRDKGESKYNFKQMLKLAVSGVTSFSLAPLRLAIYLGALVCAAGFAYLLYTVVYFLFGNELLSGWFSTIGTVLILGGIQLLSTGLLGIYVGKIFMATKNRPSYVIDEEAGFNVSHNPK